MPTLRGLTIVLTTADPAGFEAALALASASAALGARTRLFCHDAAVLSIASPSLATARDVEVAFIVCQSSLATHGMALPGWTEAGGMISLLADLGDDRLVTI